jgi:hypothetical protein
MDVKKLPSKGSWDRFQNQKERKLFASASQALFRVQEKHQIEHVWVSFHTFWAPTFLIDENCKITELMHLWTRASRLFCVHLVPDFRAEPLTISRMAKSTEKRKKVRLFQRFFHPSLSTFPPFPTFSAFANFYM